MLLSFQFFNSACASRFASELIVLLGVTCTRLKRGGKCVGSERQGLKASWTEIVCDLDYNELKRVLLRTLADGGSLDSTTLFEKLNSAGPERFEIHAVRMALVRYYRQGLLRRERSGGEFRYALSTRGIARLSWLEGRTNSSAT
jgi:hypothetical protein